MIDGLDRFFFCENSGLQSGLFRYKNLSLLVRKHLHQPPMKKIIYCSFFVWLVSLQSFGQVAIGTGSTPPTPDPAAVLLLQGNGTNQGLIVPVVQNVNASTFGKEGMVVFDKASGRLQYHTGTGWVSVGGGSGSVGLRFQGNVLSLDPTGTSSIGLATPAPGSGTDQGRLLVWDGTQWSTTPRPTAVGQVLQWNGTAWLLSTITGGTGTVTNVTGTAPISVATGTSTPVVSLNPIADANISPSANIQGSKLQDASLPLTKLSSGSATNGQVIQFNGTNWVPANLSGGGTISGVTAGTGLTGGGTSGSVTLNLANTTVTPSTYGSATNIPQIAIDAQGRITSASNVPIAAVLPTLGGDISGASLSATTVTGIQGRGISAAAPSTNQVLQFNGTNWAPANLAGGGTVTNVTGTGPISVANGSTTPAISLNLTATDIPSLDATKITTGVFGTGQIPNLDASKITSGTLPVSVGGTGRTTWNGLLVGAGSTINDISNGSNGQVLTIAGGNPTWQTPTPGGAAGGSLAGTYPNPTIAAGAITTAELAANSVVTVDIANLAVTDAKINDVAPGKITQAGASTGQVLKWNGTAWAPAADAVGGGGAPTLNPGQIIVGDGSTNSAATIGQDASLNSTNGNITVQGLRGRPIAATAPTTNSVYQFDGTQWTPVVLAGGGTVSNIATGAGLTGGPITATGTISVAAGGIGTTELANTSVTTAKLAANAVTNAQIVDGTIADADISGTAAIAVTKLATGTNGQVLTVSGGVPSWQTSAALTNPMTAPNDLIVGGTAGAATRLAAPGNNQLLTTNGTGAVTWAPQTNFIAGGSQAANLVLASPNGSAGNPTFRQLVNADIAAGAAIAGTKISGNFGAGNLTTTGTLTVSGGTTLSNTSLQIGAVPYTWPGAQGAAGTVLTNNGSGTLTWTAPTSSWGLTGNAGINPTTNYLGTSDSQPLRFATAATERARIDASGNLVIGTTTALGKLHVENSEWANNSAILTSTAGSAGATLRFTNAASGNHTYDVIGSTGSGSSPGVGSFGIWDNTAGTYRFVISPLGNVGLGVVSPTSSLEIDGGTSTTQLLTSFNSSGTSFASSASSLTLQSGTTSIASTRWAINTSTGGLLIFGTQSLSGRLWFSNNGGAIAVMDDTYFAPYSDSQLDLGTSSFRWNRLYYTSGVLGTSDVRLKNSIKPIHYGLNEIMKLNPVSFNWNKLPEQGTQLGLIAQEVKKLLPELVIEADNPEKTLALNHIQLIPVLIKAIQEQEKAIEQLRSENKDMKDLISKYNELSAKVESLMKSNYSSKTGSSDAKEKP
jgi:hypothetical protein